jgi:ABC-type cobalamin/Fe3+-siderophores transport system ATPase subunit
VADGLSLQEVTAGYGSRTALRDATFDVHSGEVVGLVGPNGSGKTTAVRVASRSLRPRSGRVLLAGEDPYAISARRAAQLVAVVPQEVAPTFEFTAHEVVLMGRTPYLSTFGGGGPEDARLVREAMDVAGIEGLADRPLGELSGGEKQRVVLAQALAQDAPVLIFDEPTTHLDLRHLVDMLDTLRVLAGEGRAVLVVFHDLNMAASSCDRLAVLSAGSVVAQGTPEQVITAELLRDVYEVEAEVRPHAITGRPTVHVAAGSRELAGRPRRQA